MNPLPIDSTASDAASATGSHAVLVNAPGSLESLEVHMDLAAARIVGGVPAAMRKDPASSLQEVRPNGLPAIPEPKRKGLTKYRLIAAIGWYYVGVILLSWLLLRFASDRWIPGTLLMFAPRWPLALPFPFLLTAAWKCGRKLRWTLAASGVIVLVWLTGLCLPIRRLWTWPSDKDFHLRIMTFNAHHRSTDYSSFAVLVEREKPDIILIQDFSELLAPLPAADYPWRERRREELYIASKFPIVFAEDFAEQRGGDGITSQSLGHASHFVVQMPPGNVDLVNLHLESPHMVFEDLIDRGETGGVESNSRNRVAEAHYIQHQVADFPRPILTGDFNTPADSNLYRDAFPDFSNAFTQTGFGFGYTYYTRIAQFRIDQILYRSGWKCLNSWVGPDVGSAHRPLFADLQWN